MDAGRNRRRDGQNRHRISLGNGRTTAPAGNGWNRSKNNAEFGVDYYNCTGTSKSNMFDNKPDETQYFIPTMMPPVTSFQATMITR